VWQPGEHHAEHDIAWSRRFFTALDGFRDGVYVNFLGSDEHPDRIREAYGNDTYQRLRDVKTVYDPDNVFHHNQNIRPRSA
jgi:FAD/FMN-containing dehydrogenase